VSAIHIDTVLLRTYGITIGCVGGVLLYHAYHSLFLCSTVVLTIVLLGIHRRVSGVGIVICLFFIAGFARLYVVEHAVDTQLDRVVGSEVQLDGVIIAEPDRRDHVIHYVIDIDQSDEHVRMTLRQFPRLQYGDRVRLRGELSFPETFVNDSGLSFNYVGFLAKDGIRYVSFTPHVEVLEQGKGNVVLQHLFTWKQWFVLELTRALKQPEGALASGILLGTKQSLGESLLQAFQRSGLIHIIVLSGSNVAIISDAIRRLFYRLPPTIGTVLTIFMIIVFACMTGASATTIRASIMAILAVIAFRNTRTYNVHRALSVACVLMVLENPLILLYDPGFQLSFLASVGLIYGSPIIDRLITHVIKHEGFRQIIASTLATQITVSPLIISMTGQVSVISLITNLLVLPIVPIAMALSALVPLVSSFGIWGMPLVILSKSILYYIIFIATFFGSLTFATMQVVG
jgi:competence protein ComEC